MLKIHFLNVGHGDCTIIEHASGRLTMIDINNGTELDAKSLRELAESYQLAPALRSVLSGTLSGQSPMVMKASIRQAYDELIRKGYDIALTNPVEYLKQQYPGKDLFRYIQSHPDLDHMRGLIALEKENIDMSNFWDTEHEKTPDFQSEDDKREWAAYQKLRAEKNGTKVLRLYRGAEGSYWSQDPSGTAGGDGLEILAPTPAIVQAANEADKTNNLSYVLRLTYQGVKVILCGDAEQEVWDDLVERYGDALKCDVLKASHHGRDSGYHQEAVKLMNPEFTIVSVGKKPETDASNKYRQYSDNVWSTRWRGNIVLTVDDGGKGIVSSQYQR